MPPPASADDNGEETPALADLTDFYRAWKVVDAAESFSPAVRGRAFSLWVALFGCVDPDGVVTRNVAELATEFSVSRMAWLQYRELLVEVGLIEQQRIDHGATRPTVVRLKPPLKPAK